ncbi:molecular chaperone OsmY [Klebsiella aerogenes]|uniref:molecular chaperone OsmY n=1 Tax=Klebsiella aerogenes TaxID=548 RepID=UPI0039B6EF19
MLRILLSSISAALTRAVIVLSSIKSPTLLIDLSTLSPALIDDKSIRSTDISVKTENKVVTLSGTVESAEQKSQAVSAAKGVEGVSSVSDKLTVAGEKSASLKGYAGDTAITSEVKAKLLADDIVPSRKVTVETSNGVVHLSGTLESSKQVDRAADIAKAVTGVKSVKNDLKVQ